MAKYGVRVPPGIACHTPEGVAAAAAKVSGESGEVVVKSQVRTTPSFRFKSVREKRECKDDVLIFSHPHKSLPSLPPGARRRPRPGHVQERPTGRRAHRPRR